MIYHFGNYKLQNLFEEDGFPQIHHISDLELKEEKGYQAMHYHMDRLEIIYIKEGEGIHTVGERQYHTKPGEVVIFNQKIPHEERAYGTMNLKFYCCAVTDMQLRGMGRNQIVSEGETPILDVRKDETIEKIFSALLSAGALGGENTREICSYLSAALISRLIEIKNISENIRGGAERSREQQDGDIVKQVRKYLDENYLKKVNLNQVAEAVSVSSFYLDRIFKKETGISVGQYLIHRKLGHAQSLLTDTDEPIVKIAEMVGYDNPSYFSQLFKKKFGVTPRAYRDNLGIVK